MAQDSEHFLNELPIWKLKAVAAEYKIDVSACRYKRDFVEKIRAKKLTEDQVRRALESSRKSHEQAAEEMAASAEAEKIADEIEKIANKPAQPTELPEEEEKSVERHIDEALTLKPSFFEVDSTTESALNRMIIGDFNEAIKINRDARLKCLESFSIFEVYSAAVSIRAADELLAKISDEKGKLDPDLRTALAAAKRAFISGSPRQREEALENLETLVTKAYAAFISQSENEEAELKDLLADYESFGTRTEESRKYLEMAVSAKQAFDFPHYRKFVKDAREHAEAAKGIRTKEIENAFYMVRASAAEAKDLGADVSTAEADIGEARKAFDEGSFRRAVDLLASVERATDAAHLEQIRKRKELETRQMEKANATIATYGPMIAEAGSYGMDVREASFYMDGLRNALARKDVVLAAKLARRTKELMDDMEQPLDQKRLELGVIKRVEGARCGKCGHESLYAYPDGTQKCLECGHSFSTAPMAGAGHTERAPEVAEITSTSEAKAGSSEETEISQPTKEEQPGRPAEKKKKGFFRW